jgi:hypothetical protein
MAVEYEKELIFFFDQKLQYTVGTVSILGLHKGRPSYRRSLQLSKENMKFLNFFNFCGSILPSWIQIPKTDTDPLT